MTIGTFNFPDWRSAPRIAIDLETFDPRIEEGKGSGALFGGFIAGVAVSVGPGRSVYLPINHERGFNYDQTKVLSWLDEQLSAIPIKVGANILYDLEYLTVAGVSGALSGIHYDVQIAEPLLDEKAFSYSLDNIGKKYFGEGKSQEAMDQWLAYNFGGPVKHDKQAKNIWRAPAEIVEEYAIMDVELPLRIIDVQLEEIKKQELMDVFILESELIPMLLAMKMRGVKIDMQRVERVETELTQQILDQQASLDDIAGFPVGVNKAAQLAQVWDKLGIKYSKTPTGKPSFTKDTLADVDHPVGGLVRGIRSGMKLRDTFARNAIMGMHRQGRIHCQFNQLKSDDFGTVSGRLSSSNPNLQQVPKRGASKKIIRSLYIPDEGDEWVSLDWSQIEYRLFAHYAQDERLVTAYNEDSSTDFHAAVGALLGGTLSREMTKNFNFGMLYGAGFVKIASMLRANLSREDADALAESLGPMKDRPKFQRSVSYRQTKMDPTFSPDMYDEIAFRVLEVYEETFPAAKKIMDESSRVAKTRGYIKTILGRRRRFHHESTHKALNSLLQGSAADLMKKAMVDIWKSGVCDVLGAPLLTVHDELDWSKPKTDIAMDAIREVKHLMETVLPFRVPIIAEMEIGPNWGNLEKVK